MMLFRVIPGRIVPTIAGVEITSSYNAEKECKSKSNSIFQMSKQDMITRDFWSVKNSCVVAKRGGY